MFRIIENTDDFLLVDKSPDVSFHKERDNQGLLGILKQELQLSELYPVHRLDKMTSGLVIFAKSTDVNRELSMQFEARRIEKYYLALSDKKPKKKQGMVKGDMERSRRGSWKMLPSQTNPAVTQFFSSGLGDGLRLFLLKPFTGKTHQLRVALKSIGAPILGDPLYRAGDQQLEVDRGYLHAYCLGFSLKGRDYRFLCKPSQGKYFNAGAVVQALADPEENWAEPWALNWPKL